MIRTGDDVVDSLLATGLVTLASPADFTGRIVAAPRSPSRGDDEPSTVFDLSDDVAARVDRRWAARERYRRRRGQG